MVDVLRVLSLGVPIDVELPDGAGLERLQRQWVRSLRDSGGATQTIGSDLANFEPERPDVWDYRLTTQVTVTALSHTAGQRLNFHAAGLALDGRVLALVAASGTGKTTATRALGPRMDYLSDETVSVGEGFDVAPHAKPLSIISDASRPGFKTQVSPDDLAFGPTPYDAQLGRMVMLVRDPLVEQPGLTRVDLAEALVTLLPQTSSLSAVPDPLSRLAELLRHVGGLHVLRYREITEHVDQLISLLTAPIEPQTQTVLEIPPDPALASARPVPPAERELADLAAQELSEAGTWQRTAYVQALAIDDEIVVMHQGRGMRLSQLPGALWLAADRPISQDELVAVAEAEFGSHPQAVELVRQGLTSLNESGLLNHVQA